MQPSSMREWRDVTTAVFKEQILPLNQPAVLRGLVGDWPAVRAGLESALVHAMLAVRSLPPHHKPRRSQFALTRVSLSDAAKTTRVFAALR